MAEEAEEVKKGRQLTLKSRLVAVQLRALGSLHCEQMPPLKVKPAKQLVQSVGLPGAQEAQEGSQRYILPSSAKV
jgi:hypothetical protein